MKSSSRYAELVLLMGTSMCGIRKPRALLDLLIHEATSRFRRVTKGVAVGSWDPPNSQLYDAARELGYADSLLAQGVVGEVAATLIAEGGNSVTTINDRTIAIPAEALKNITEVISVGDGASKARAMRGSHRGRPGTFRCRRCFAGTRTADHEIATKHRLSWRRPSKAVPHAAVVLP
ncbi:sugar-binding domain-containing protein [Arthrobacter sp. NPDC093128]|uniref:sugar-binding domain-containing protein n=1 Tax=Arthrobacter sp. NPDC093128 TaxID=3154979 RepID=UPI0034275C42